MPFVQAKEIKYYQFGLFVAAPIAHGVFTRRGGLSMGQWSSLNVEATVGDNLDHVAENRRRSFEALGRDIESKFDSWLVHGTEVLFAEAPRDPASLYPPKADIIFTDRPGVSLFMRYADCVPILLYDPEKQIVGLAHAGWRGTVDRAAEVAVTAMSEHYGSQPEDILAAIGPSICPQHYRVGPEVASQVEAVFGERASSLLPVQDGAAHFDLWEANRLLLEDAGLRRVEVAEVCTACHLEDWYSHRAEQGKTGRFGALIGLDSA